MNKTARMLLSLLVLISASMPSYTDTLNSTALESVFDQFFDPQKHTYTGAVAVVVHGGKVVLQKGYGYRDTQRTLPVDAGSTRFRLASTTKTLVAVGIGQLIDIGLIKSIDDPANNYLKTWQLPANEGEAITLRMLATHQAGFAETRQAFQRAGETPPHIDGSYLLEHIAPYIRKVNSGANYSNYGIDVLANVIEEQTGLSFKDYVQKFIFTPLEMAGAIIVDTPVALPDMAEAQMFYPDGTSMANPATWANNPMNTASGALAASGADMASYMLALLDQDSDLLSADARELLMSRQGETHPLAQGYGVVFMHNIYNGTTLIEHGGSTLANISYTTLIPEHNLGIFVSLTGRKGMIPPGFEQLGIVSSERNGPAVSLPINFPGFFDARAAYLETLLGLPLPPDVSAPSYETDLGEYVGVYTPERRQKRSVTKLFELLLRNPGIAVSQTGDGLKIGSAEVYTPIAAELFWRDPQSEPKMSTGWRDFYAFTRNENYEVSEMVSQYTDTVFVKRTGLASPDLQLYIFSITSSILITGIALAFYGGGIRQNATQVGLAFALLSLPISYIAAWPRLGNEAISYVSISPGDLIPMQLLGNACALFMLALLVRLPMKLSATSGVAQLHNALLAIAAIPGIWVFWQLDLIGWNIH